MSTLRIHGIEAKSDPTSASVNEKIKITNSSGELLFHLDGTQSGIGTVGITTTGTTFHVDRATQEITFVTDAVFNGTVGIAGTLTYEDVTNVDAVGILTARSGINVTSGSIGINTTGGNEKLNAFGAIRSSGSSANFNAGLEGTLLDYDIVNRVSRVGHVNGASGSARPLAFLTGGTERLRITSDGLLKLTGLTLSQRNSATGVNGGLIYNSDGKILQYYDGSGWISLNTTNQIVATGGNSVTTGTGAAAGYRIHTFTGGGTFVITSGFGEVEVLVVAGGGSEGGASSGCHAGGGGGGGGVVYKKMNLSAGNYPISIGSGGSWRNNGGNTVFGNGTDHQITAVGGGAGGPTLTGNGNQGGSGGGGSRHDTSNQGGAAQQPGTTDGGFGNAGGNTGSNTNPGGGGGAGGAGNSGSAGSNPGRGGAGKQFTQFGVTTYFGAGGNGNGGGSDTGPEGQTGTSSNGAANTGAGGGGSSGGGTRYSGGSGIVMIRYPAAS